MNYQTVWGMPLWLWRQYADWQDGHIEGMKKRAEGDRCVNC